MRPWIGYALRRLLTSAGVLLGVLLLTYGLSRLSDVDPVDRYLEASEELDRSGGSDSDARRYRAAARRLGVDLPPFFFGLSPKHHPDTLYRVLPLSARETIIAEANKRLSRNGGTASLLPKLSWYGTPNGFTRFAGGVVSGDFGYSLRDGQPAARSILRALRTTAPIALLGLLLAAALGIVLGVQMAWRRLGWLRTACYVLLSSPGFFLSALAVSVFAGRGRLFPGPGWVDASAGVGEWLAHATLPILILGLPAAAYIALVLEESLLSADRAPIREFARMQGRTEAQVWWGDMLPLGLVPGVVTVVGLLVPSFIGGSVVVEYVFNIPGLGRLVFESILARDWPLVLGVVTLSSFATVLGYLMIDLVNAWIDPRWRKFVVHVG